ncbi:hypothetical protein GCM10010492_66710 [Saccharothrix mutabilis subsp. mutabilis]|uniref:Hint domain-containing protein n=2 Tax=Saccharothrix mutabilis TaxID=33921 RepID=A0ABP3E9T0_9PSEU
MQTSCGSSRTQTATSEYPKCAECRNGPWSREKLQMFIDMMGVAVPAIGDGADLANCGIHAAYGEWGDASLSCAAAVPIVGIAAGLAKMAKNGQKLADTAGDGKAAVKCANSFTGDTHVLMADGTTKPIDQIKVGDKVTNSEPESAETEQHVVLAVIVTDADKDYADLTIATPDGNKTIRATAHHPIYNATAKRWVDAGDLDPGDQLNTPGNGRAAIQATRHYTATLRTYNLTIDVVHTYYVLAGSTSVLVHNSGGCPHVNLDAVPEDLRGPARDVIDSMDKNGTLPPGVQQGGTRGMPGIYGGEGLPAAPPRYYVETDILPTPPGGKRPASGRLVFGGRGEVWYTEHYKDGFVQLRGANCGC